MVGKKLGTIGSAIMFTFGSIAVWRWIQTDMLFFALFALRDFLAAGFLFGRRKAISKCTPIQQVTAYISSCLPFLYQSSNFPLLQSVAILQGVLVVGGFTLATLATIELGFQMGVSPANRGKKISTGVYRFLNHPMYFGYAIAEMGVIAINPASNALLFVISTGLYVYRARLENQILSECNQQRSEPLSIADRIRPVLHQSKS